MTKLHQLANLGQAIWFDYIRRSFITSGGLQALIDEGLRGVTSNPSIFEKAIAGSTDYDDVLHRLVEEGKTVEEIYEALTLEDIQRATDLYVTDEGRVYEAAKRYYAEIMMPFRKIIQKNLKKVQGYEISLIAPSHGPMYGRPEFILG